MYVISINSRDGKPIVSPFVVKSLDGINSFFDAALAAGGIVIIDTISFYSSAASAKDSVFESQKIG